MKGLSLLVLWALVAGAAAAQTSATCQSGGVKLRYRIFGKGKAVVILSGGPGFSSDYMLPVAERLGKANQAILLDQRGTGQSKLEEVDGSTVNLNAYIQDLECLRKALGKERLVLLGHSWGGMLAMAYAARHPDRVEGLVLAGSGGIDMSYMTEFGKRLRAKTTAEDEAEMATLTQGGPPNDATAKKLGRLMLKPYVVNLDAIESIVKFVDAGFYNPQIDASMGQDLFQNYDLTKSLGAYKGPALIVQGRGDPIGESTVAQTMKVLPQAKAVWLKDCGHFGWAERPAEFFTAVEEFLAKVK